MQYILIIFFSCHKSFQILPTSLPTQLRILSLYQKNNKTKMKNPSNYNKRKHTIKHEGSFCVSQVLLSTKPTLECSWYTQLKSLKNPDYPPAMRYQVHVDSGLGVGLSAHIPFSMLRFLSYLNLCRSHACCYGLCLSSYISV